MFVVGGLFFCCKQKFTHYNYFVWDPTLNEKYKAYKAKYNNYNVQTIDSNKYVTKVKIICVSTYNTIAIRSIYVIINQAKM